MGLSSIESSICCDATVKIPLTVIASQRTDANYEKFSFASRTLKTVMHGSSKCQAALKSITVIEANESLWNHPIRF